jgi:alpha-beta hydrolase superfamily lysophospholipase
LATPDVTQRFVASDGFSIAYRHWKTTDLKRVVICIHGIGDYSGWFRNLAPELAVDDSEVYALDLRGFGESQQHDSPRGYVNDFGRHLQDIDEFVRYFRDQHNGISVFILGHSLGGVYSIWYAANHPSSVDGLVLASPAVICNLDNTCSDKDRDPEEIQIMLNDPLETWQLTTDYLSKVKEVLLADVFGDASRVRVPTIILQGNADITVKPFGAKQLYEALTVVDKKLVFFDDAGHWFYDALSPAPPRSKIESKKRQQFFDAVKDWLYSH